MITSEDIAIKVRAVLSASCQNITIEWQRHGYEKTNSIVIVPHTAEGEGKIRTVVVKVNIHVPDIYDTENNCYETDIATLNTIKKQVINALKTHTESNMSANWRITSLDPAIKEPEYNEHFVSINIEAYIRERIN